ncbi:MAG: EAL domain-containing protein [Deltaproteobacteria bacterium]|nr:MAG: EAL domain-containing protein [Deltaproteobacteria bacterium]
MTLTRQLWLAILVVMLISFGGTCFISLLSARDYIHRQLTIQNQDNAAALALSLSQMAKDKGTLELLVGAQFDSGHYRAIKLVAPDGTILVERSNPVIEMPVPAWFERFFPLEVDVARISIQDGWNVFGDLILQSDARFAYLSLWDEARRLAWWFGLGAMVCGILGSLLLRWVTRPLDRVIEQANAIAGRRFITVDVPRTREFRNLTDAMNTMATRVRTMLEEEALRLEELQVQFQHDPLTGLLTRTAFLSRLRAQLADESAGGVKFALGRICRLDQLNVAFGWETVDQLLSRIGERLSSLVDERDGWFAGRLSGADFGLLAPGNADLENLAQLLSAELHLAVNDCSLDTKLEMAVGATSAGLGEVASQVLARADGALIEAERSGGLALRLASTGQASSGIKGLAGWRTALQSALQPLNVRLASYPVVDRSGALMYEECPVRVRIEDEWQSAAAILPWVARLGLLPRLDLLVLREALQNLVGLDRRIGIHMSSESLCDPVFRDELSALLRECDEDVRARLWIEMPETAAVRHLHEFKMLCAELKPFRCHIGVEHLGNHLGRIGWLHDVGIDFAKLDASLVADVDTHQGNQALIRGLCTTCHAIGLKVLAEGVQTAEERTMLLSLGVDGLTGPGIRLGQ